MNCPICNSTRSANFQGRSSWWVDMPTWKEEWMVHCIDCLHTWLEIRHFSSGAPFTTTKIEIWCASCQLPPEECRCEKGKEATGTPRTVHKF